MSPDEPPEKRRPTFRMDVGYKTHIMRGPSFAVPADTKTVPASPLPKLQNGDTEFVKRLEVGVIVYKPADPDHRNPTLTFNIPGDNDGRTGVIELINHVLGNDAAAQSTAKSVTIIGPDATFLAGVLKVSGFGFDGDRHINVGRSSPDR